MRRKWVLVGVGATMPLLLVVATLFRQPYRDPLEEKAARIQEGMTVEDATAVLGSPPDEICRTAESGWPVGAEWSWWFDGDRHHVAAVLVVRTDERNRAVEAHVR